MVKFNLYTIAINMYILNDNLHRFKERKSTVHVSYQVSVSPEDGVV